MKSKLLNSDKFQNFTWYYSLIVIAFLLGLNNSICRSIDTDAYFLIATGRYILENHVVPTINPFVLHEGFGMIVQQWIPCIFNAIFYDLGGSMGLAVYAFILNCITLYAIYRCAIEYCGEKNKIFINVFALVFQFILLPYITSRPSNLSIGIMFFELLILKRYQNTGNKKVLLLLPLVSLMQVNWHASLWPFIFVLLLPYLVPAVWNLNKETWKKHIKFAMPIAIMIIPMFLIAFLNPNGWDGMMYLVKSFSSVASQSTIVELGYPAIFSSTGVYALLSIVMLAFYIMKHKGQSDSAVIYLYLGTLVLACRYMRNSFFIILGMVPLICDLFLDIFKKIKPSKTLITKAFSIVLIGCMLLCGIAITKNALEIDTTDSGYVEEDYAEQIIEYLNQYDKEDITLFAGFNYGAYMEMNGYKPYIDARPELYMTKINHKEDIFEEYMDLYYGETKYEEFLEKYDFTHLVIAQDGYFEKYMANYAEELGYKEILAGENVTLYERIDFNQ